MAEWEQWIGRQIVQQDRLTQAALTRFRATIDSQAITGGLMTAFSHQTS